MKTISSLILFFAVAAGSLRADSLAPFADSKPGSTVTSNGEIGVAAHPGTVPSYFVRFRTDTGPRQLMAEIPTALIRPEIFGRPASITATIHERAAPQSQAKLRFLEVLKIEFSK